MPKSVSIGDVLQPSSTLKPLAIMVYEGTQLPASLLHVDTKLHSLLPFLTFIPVRQITAISLHPGVEMCVKTRYRTVICSYRFTSYQINILSLIWQCAKLLWVGHPTPCCIHCCHLFERTPHSPSVDIGLFFMYILLTLV